MTQASEEYEGKQGLFRAPVEAAWSLFGRAPAVHFAASGQRGPVLRTLSAVVLDQRLCFHGGDSGEKLGLVGAHAVASYEEVVAQIASHWIHPELACPASTYYVSALAEGQIERVHDLEQKARILAALMRRFQPEGGYDPIDAADKRYRKVLEQLLVAELVPTRVSAKHKLGQHRTKAQIERVASGLWQRGAAGDLRAIRAILEAHPERPRPPFLSGPLATDLCVAPDRADALEVAAMLEGQYWTTDLSRERMAAAQLGSTAWVVARAAPTGQVVASARALSDHARFGYVLDVIVRPELRGHGLARALMRLLLDHPAMRELVVIALRTRDAHALYREFGFADVPPAATGMALVRPASTTREAARARP